ncbi:MAG TPA: hypothetical protein VE007_07660 [Thermoanaerobaculia bacterium]|nr:hypothetical protein [Thermoanaerobaculia bacterium]
MTKLSRSLAAAILLASAAAASFAAPDRPVGLDVHPSLLELHVSAGETIERRVTLTNPGEDSLDVVAETADWTMSESGEVRFEAAGTGANPRSCAGWIAVTPPKIRVPPKGEATVSVQISAPADLDGTRWAVVFFRLPDVPGFHGGRPADLTARVALTVYATGSGTEREDLELAGLSAVGSPEILLRAAFENAGNTAVRVKMTWQIRSASGSVVRTDTATVVCLPGSRREALDRVPKLPAGSYKVSAMARWGNRRWRLRECALDVPAKASASGRLVS